LFSILKLFVLAGVLRALQANNSLLSDLIDTNIANCHIVSNAYWGNDDSLPPSCEQHTTLSSYTLSLQASYHSRSRVQARLLTAILSWYFVWCILSLNTSHYVASNMAYFIFFYFFKLMLFLLYVKMVYSELF
jgi:hypothetical protein